MKKFLILSVLALGACSSAQLADTQQNLAKLRTIIANGCAVVQPVLLTVAPLDPTVAAATAANGLFCKGVESIDASSVQAAVNTSIPALSSALNGSDKIPADKKPLVVGALAAFQMLLINALAVYAPNS